MNEHGIQNAIRNALAGLAIIFRANVGQAWTGSKVERLNARDVVIRDARPFSTGLPPGFSDLFGLVPVVVTPEMVGQTMGQFVAMEVKQPGKNPAEKQANFLAAVRKMGGRSGVVRAPADALELIGASK
jgi:hypothetical protein